MNRAVVSQDVAPPTVNRGTRLFEFNVKRLDWTDIEASWALLNSLTGRAAAAVSSLPEDLQADPQYSLLRRWLQDRFGTKTDPRVARMELFHRHLDESLEEFATALETLAADAYPEDSTAANRSGVDAFIGRMRNQVVSEYSPQRPSVPRPTIGSRHCTKGQLSFAVCRSSRPAPELVSNVIIFVGENIPSGTIW